MLPGARLMELGQQECKTQTLTLSGATGNYAWRGLASPNLLAYVKTRFEVQGLTVPEAAIYLASNPTFGDIVNVKITIRPQQGIHTVTLNIDDAAPLTSAQWYWPGQSALESAQLVSASITYDCMDPKGETQLVRVAWPAPYATLPMLVQRAPTGERTSEAAIISRNNNTGSYTDDPGVGTWDYRLGYLGEWGPWAEIVVPPPDIGGHPCGTIALTHRNDLNGWGSQPVVIRDSDMAFVPTLPQWGMSDRRISSRLRRLTVGFWAATEAEVNAARVAFLTSAIIDGTTIPLSYTAPTDASENPDPHYWQTVWQTVTRSPEAWPNWNSVSLVIPCPTLAVVEAGTWMQSSGNAAYWEKSAQGTQLNAYHLNNSMSLHTPYPHIFTAQNWPEGWTVTYSYVDGQTKRQTLTLPPFSAVQREPPASRPGYSTWFFTLPSVLEQSSKWTACTVASPSGLDVPMPRGLGGCG